MIDGSLVQGQTNSGLGTRVVRGAALGFLMILGANLFLFAGQLLIPRLLSRAEYAQFTVSISFVAIMALMADLGMTSMFTRMFAQAEEQLLNGGEDERGKLLGTALLLRLALSVFVAILVLAIAPRIYSRQMVQAMGILLITLFISPRLVVVRSVGESVMRSIGKFHLTAFFALVDAAVFAILLYGYSSLGLSLLEVVWIYALCNLPGFLLLLVSIGRWVKQEGIRLSVEISLLRRILYTALPLSLWTAFYTIHNEADKILLDRLSNPMEVSSYAVSVRLLGAILPVAIVLAAVSAPELTRLLHRNDHRRSRQLTSYAIRILLALSGGIALVIAATSDKFVVLLFGLKYASAGPLFAYGGWILIPSLTAAYLVEMSIAAGNNWYSTVYALVIMIVVVVGDIILIPTLGAEGALVSKFLAVSVGCISLIVLMRNSLYFDIRGFLLASVRIAASCLVAFVAIAYCRHVGLNEWMSGGIVLLLYPGMLYITRAFSISDLSALLRKFRRVEN